jgi:predicted ATP-grasp superfamily ATP-dependent carboligase
MRILITGVSTRAIAESVVHSFSLAEGNGGQQIITLDYFGDRDQRSLVENYALLRDFGVAFSAQTLLQASRALDYEAVIYISNLENHDDVVEEMARGRTLLGNAPAVLRQVRDWRVLREFCRTAPIPCPTTLLPGEEGQAEPGARWLCKPVRSGGGHGIYYWDGVQQLDRAYILQRYIAGRPASAAFVADGRRSVVIGLTEQLVGQEALGTEGFTWCGNILPLAIRSEGAALLPSVQRMADELTRRFGLRGVNGMDLVIGAGPQGSLGPFVVEVNPRYTASMELMERAYGLNIFSLHLAALRGQLPGFSLAEHLAGALFAKGIVYARSTVTMPETAGWIEKGRRDIPYSGERVQAGHPICTVLADGNSREECWDHLLAAVQAVRREIAAAGGGSP